MEAVERKPVVLAEYESCGERLRVTETRGATLGRPLVSLVHEYSDGGTPRGVVLDPDQALRAGTALVAFARKHGART